jgi:MFS family permease
VRELLASGFRYTWNDRRLRAVIGAIGVSSFFAAPVSALLPIFAAKVYGGGSGVYGALAAAMGVGSVIGALVVARLGNRVSPAIVAASLVGVGVVLAMFAAIAAFAAGLVLILLYGAAYLVAIAATNGDIQLHVEESMRGRVLSLYFLSFGALFPLGSLAAGSVAELIGVRWTTAIGAAVCVVWGARLFVRFRRPATSLGIAGPVVETGP